MTIIVGVPNGKHVYLGADSRATNGSLVRPNPHPKVWKKDGMVFGVSGRLRESQVIQHLTAFPALPEPDDLMPWLVGPFIDALRYSLKAAGYDERIDGQPQCEYGPVMLVGVLGRLFGLSGDYSVVEYPDGGAIGSGEVAAWGSLQTSLLFDEESPRERIRLALIAACTHDIYCAPPFTFVSTEPEPVKVVCGGCGRKVYVADRSCDNCGQEIHEGESLVEAQDEVKHAVEVDGEGRVRVREVSLNHPTAAWAELEPDHGPTISEVAGPELVASGDALAITPADECWADYAQRMRAANERALDALRGGSTQLLADAEVMLSDALCGEGPAFEDERRSIERWISNLQVRRLKLLGDGPPVDDRVEGEWSEETFVSVETALAKVDLRVFTAGMLALLMECDNAAERSPQLGHTRTAALVSAATADRLRLLLGLPRRWGPPPTGGRES